MASGKEESTSSSSATTAGEIISKQVRFLCRCNQIIGDTLVRVYILYWPLYLSSWTTTSSSTSARTWRARSLPGTSILWSREPKMPVCTSAQGESGHVTCRTITLYFPLSHFLGTLSCWNAHSFTSSPNSIVADAIVSFYLYILRVFSLTTQKCLHNAKVFVLPCIRLDNA